MVEKTKAQLLEENKKLREKNTQGELPKSLRKANSFMDEMQKIKQKATVDVDSIKVKDFSDHYNISLWTRLGKRVGPLHRTNAEAALKRFWDVGVQLSVDEPTAEDIEEYKTTDEYKEWKKNEDNRRAIKSKSLRKENMEKLVTEMAKLTGQNVTAITSLLNDGPVSLQEGQKMAGVK